MMKKINKSLIFIPIAILALSACSSSENDAETNAKKAINDSSSNVSIKESNKTTQSIIEKEPSTKTTSSEVLDSLVNEEGDTDGNISVESQNKSNEYKVSSDEEFKPHVQAVIDQMNGVPNNASSDNPPVELKQEYKDVAERLEEMMPSN